MRDGRGTLRYATGDTYEGLFLVHALAPGRAIVPSAWPSAFRHPPLGSIPPLSASASRAEFRRPPLVPQTLLGLRVTVVRPSRRRSAAAAADSLGRSSSSAA